MMLAYDPTTNPLNQIEWMFGFLECVHILSFAVAIGTIGLVDLRLLGAGPKGSAPAQILRDTTFWTIGGLACAITSGLLLFSTDPERYAANPAFRFKVVCLALALIYNYTVHRKVAGSKPSRIAGVLTGMLSLLLWIPVIFGGLFYAFTG